MKINNFLSLLRYGDIILNYHCTLSSNSTRTSNELITRELLKPNLNENLTEVADINSTISQQKNNNFLRQLSTLNKHILNCYRINLFISGQSLPCNSGTCKQSKFEFPTPKSIIRKVREWKFKRYSKPYDSNSDCRSLIRCLFPGERRKVKYSSTDVWMVFITFAVFICFIKLTR